MNREILARERLEADRRYNDALSALDRAIIDAGNSPDLARADFERIADKLILFLQRITEFVDTKDRERAADAAERIATVAGAIDAVAELRTQVNVLQRAIRSGSAPSTLAPSIQAPSTSAPGTQAPSTPAPSTAAPSTPALSTPAPSTPAPSTQAPSTAAPGTPAPSTQAPGTTAPGTSTRHHAQGTRHPFSDPVYVAFEDEFRGSDETIAGNVRRYVPIFERANGPVIDLGCGRGELLAALKAVGVQAKGVDANADMAAIARERGVDAVHGDALAFLESCPDESLGGIIATQVVEHLEPSYLMQLVAVAARKLRAAAPIVLETINPACWLAFFSSYIRDITHVRPIHPDTLQYLLRANGFERVEIRYSAAVPDAIKLKTVDVPAAMRGSADPLAAAISAVGDTLNANAAILNSLMFTHLDYAAVGFRG